MPDTKHKAFIEFGDGTQALFYKEGPKETKDDGREYVQLLILPTRDIREIYKIEAKDLTYALPDGYKGIWCEFPYECVHWVRMEPGAAKIWITCNFDGSESTFDHSFHYKYKRKLNEVLQERDQWKLATLTKMDEMRKILSQQTELFNQIKKFQETAVASKPKDANDDEKSSIPNIIGGS